MEDIIGWLFLYIMVLIAVLLSFLAYDYYKER
jgi:hypothetical protein